MEEMAISKFKATCLAVLERVRKTGEPVLITRFGHPIAEVVAPGGLKPHAAWAPCRGAVASSAILSDLSGTNPIGKLPRNERQH